MISNRMAFALQAVRNGQVGFLFAEIWMRFYKQIQEALFFLRYRLFSAPPSPVDVTVRLETAHPVAYESPDHINPSDTKRANSTNKKFLTFMTDRVRGHGAKPPFRILDLGCAGGQLVSDFREFGWIAVGLEGSDYSLKHKRANWPALGGKNLFTCDITKPFRLNADAAPMEFHLITVWEVLEHIHQNDLPSVFTNIISHLKPGGYFIATTTSSSSIENGVELHQTKWTNQEWRNMIAQKYPELVPVELGLKSYQFVRHNAEGSFLVYQRRS